MLILLEKKTYPMAVSGWSSSSPGGWGPVLMFMSIISGSLASFLKYKNYTSVYIISELKL